MRSTWVPFHVAVVREEYFLRGLLVDLVSLLASEERLLIQPGVMGRTYALFRPDVAHACECANCASGHPLRVVKEHQEDVRIEVGHIGTSSGKGCSLLLIGGIWRAPGGRRQIGLYKMDAPSVLALARQIVGERRSELQARADRLAAERR